LQATSLYDENKNLLGSNTVIFDLTQMTDEKIIEYERFFRETNNKLDEIKEKEYDQLDKDSKSEYDGLKKMFEMLLAVNLRELKNITN
jgi:cell division septum initiation protein DivIVA